MGGSAYWPNGAQLFVTNHPRFKGQSIQVGWTHRERSGLHGAWVATKVGAEWHHGLRTLPKRLIAFEAEDYKYVGHYEDRDEAWEALKEAYSDLHKTVIV